MTNDENRMTKECPSDLMTNAIQPNKYPNRSKAQDKIPRQKAGGACFLSSRGSAIFPLHIIWRGSMLTDMQGLSLKDREEIQAVHAFARDDGLTAGAFNRHAGRP